MEKLKPNGERAKSAIIMIWIVLAVGIMSLISSCMQYNLLQTAVNGGDLSESAANANDTRESIVSILFILVYWISGITFILWFRRAYFNLHQKVSYLKYSEGWAAGCWFVPFLNLFRPYSIMNELYVETKNLLTKNGLSEKIRYSTKYLGWWWVLWLTVSFGEPFISRIILKDSHTTDTLLLATAVQMFFEVLRIPLALITVKIINDYSKAEPLLALVDREENITDQYKKD